MSEDMYLIEPWTIIIIHTFRSVRGTYIQAHLLVICGLGLIPSRSWDQNDGTDPLSWRNDVYLPLSCSSEVASCTICSVSTSLATCPSSLAPLFRKRVPAKSLDLRAIMVR